MSYVHAMVNLSISRGFAALPGRSRLARAYNACRLHDPAVFWQHLRVHLSLHSYVTFRALEALRPEAS